MEGVEFAVVNRSLAVGGQMLTIQGLGGEYDDLYLPLHGEHQSANAALALAAVELFFDAGPQRQLDIDVVRAGLAAVTSPGVWNVSGRAQPSLSMRPITPLAHELLPPLSQSPSTSAASSGSSLSWRVRTFAGSLLRWSRVRFNRGNPEFLPAQPRR